MLRLRTWNKNVDVLNIEMLAIVLLVVQAVFVLGVSEGCVQMCSSQHMRLHPLACCSCGLSRSWLVDTADPAECVWLSEAKEGTDGACPCVFIYRISRNGNCKAHPVYRDAQDAAHHGSYSEHQNSHKIHERGFRRLLQPARFALHGQIGAAEIKEVSRCIKSQPTLPSSMVY